MKSTIIQHLTLTIIVCIGLVTGVLLVRVQQVYINRAEEPLLCPNESADCSWDSQENTNSYYYKVTDLTLGQTLTEGETIETIVRFTPVIHHVYRCEVHAINECGNGPPGRAIAVCSTYLSPTISPTPTIVVPSVTLSSMPTISATPTLAPIRDGIPVVQQTPTPTVYPTDSVPQPDISPEVSPYPASSVAGWSTPQGTTKILSYVAFGIVCITILLAFVRKKRKKI